MKKLFIVFSVFIISGALLISCQKKEAVQKKTTKDPGVAVQTYDKAVETMGEYREKTEGAIDQMKDEAAGYGKKTEEAVAGYGEKAEGAAAGYGEKLKDTAGGYGR
jgi:hypothetical protein